MAKVPDLLDVVGRCCPVEERLERDHVAGNLDSADSCPAGFPSQDGACNHRGAGGGPQSTVGDPLCSVAVGASKQVCSERLAKRCDCCDGC